MRIANDATNRQCVAYCRDAVSVKAGFKDGLRSVERYFDLLRGRQS